MIRWKTPFDGATFCCGMEKKLEWEWIFSDSDLLYVDIYYMIEGSDEKHFICQNEENHELYFWEIPEDFVLRHSAIDVTFIENDYASVITPPQLILYPDPRTRTIEVQNVYVKSKGFFNTYNPDDTVDAVIEYENNEGRIISVDASATLNNYMLDAENIPLDFNCIVYDGPLESKKIKLFVRESKNLQVYAESEWFYIV